MSRVAPAIRLLTRASTAGIFRGDLPLEVRRARLERATRAMPRPRGVGIVEVRLGDRRALRARPRGSDRDRTVLYLHGGSFVAGSPETHANLGARLARAAGCNVWLLEYRLAPEHPYPAGRDDVLVAYEQLRSTGPAASPSPVTRPAGDWRYPLPWRWPTPARPARTRCSSLPHGWT